MGVGVPSPGPYAYVLILKRSDPFKWICSFKKTPVSKKFSFLDKVLLRYIYSRLLNGLKRPKYGIKNFDPDPKIVANLDPWLTAYTWQKLDEILNKVSLISIYFILVTLGPFIRENIGQSCTYLKDCFWLAWENSRDCHITMPLSLKTMEVQIKGDHWNKRFITVQVYWENKTIPDKRQIKTRLGKDASYRRTGVSGCS